MDDLQTLYDVDLPARDFIEIPPWIDPDIYVAQIAAILQGGCASGAYMPAVCYPDARRTMAERGDDVLAYIEESYGDIPAPKSGESWSGIACYYLTMAVELWAGSVAQNLADTIEGGSEND